MRHKSIKSIVFIFILIYFNYCLSSERRCDTLMSNDSTACDEHNEEFSEEICDPKSGQCVCADRRQAIGCRHCKCYAECLSRGLVINASKGWFGTHFSPDMTSGSPQYCLWILTIHPYLDATTLYSSIAISRSISRQNTPSNSAIALTIEKEMRVECPDSNIQVFDGVPDFVASGALSKKLGFYCGTDLKKDINLIAFSGFLTIFFERHDPNQGFNASYFRLDCDSCHSFANRECVDNQCVCLDYKIGSNCELNVCPNNCSADLNQGTCDQMNGRCVCMPKFGGEDCSESLSSSANRLIWSTLFNCEAAKPYLPSLSLYLPRMGHTLDSTETSLWLFGGYSNLRGQLGDMFRFNLISSRWEEIKSSNGKPDKDSPRSGQPQARHFHATAVSGDSIYLYGGLSQVNGVLGDFWRFHMSDLVWIKLETISEVPPLAGHTLTATEDRLILIGGYSSEYGFLEKVFEYSLQEEKWRVLNTTGVGPVGIYGHSAVYHSYSETIYIFGGVVYDMDKTSISGDFYALTVDWDTDINTWYRLPADEQINPIGSRPESRYLHSAVSTELYMIVIGGRNNDSNAIVNSIYAYIYRCNKWISLQMDSILISGHIPELNVALSTTLQDYNLYIFGGTNGQTNGNLYKLSLPKDLCQLFSHSRLGCLRHIGCSYCSVYENGINKTFCYSQDLTIPQSCYNPKGASEVAQGLSCGLELLERRNCYQYKSCVDCVAVWPIYSSSKQVCQWCSNCQNGRCIPFGSPCEREPQCNLNQKVISSGNMCPLRSCLASDCHKCGAIGGCMWTRQVLRSSELGHTLNVKPIFDWTCVRNILQDVTSIVVESMPPLSCPARCSRFTNCSSCLESAGGEGGHHSCSWAQNINQCISPNFVALRCEAGLCGSLVLTGSRSQCPTTCHELTQSSHCLSLPNCGWCAFNGSAVDGRGICMEGQLLGPIGGHCKAGMVNIFNYQLPPKVSKWLAQSEGPPKWAYLERPKENECLNAHHSCDERHEECIDLEDGFMCRCKPGYVIEDNQCKAQCHQGCLFGTCVAPDVCQCNFGFVGTNCSLECDCNGHSNCAGVNRLSDCLECQNHTQGLQCQKCKPFYVGNPINSGKCIPCKTYCNNHSDVCLDSTLYDLIKNFTGVLAAINSQEDIEKITGHIIEEGPDSGAVCVNCKHNTNGITCDSCVDGFFQNNSLNISEGCRRCHCNGHSDTCNKVTGEDCACDNSTETDRQCSSNNSKNSLNQCWQLQCSKCKEYFLGVPTNGHQCYRHMFLDKDYCFDPKTQEDCLRRPSGLPVGRTVFFAVQPRYMNVDIRIFVDVTKGALDLYLSAKEDTFVVDVNKTNGIHWIWLDKKYSTDIVFDTIHNDLDSLSLKRSFQSNDSFKTIASKSQTTGASLKLRHNSAEELIHYLTITDPNEFLVIRNLSNRLVITIPQEVHDLRSTRFYIILKGIRNESYLSTNMSANIYGNVFFRQDQSRIDLFVFFSVFFSCFFLFLCVCVMVWKIKQAFDMRRARRLHVQEMKHMASRPFATILIHMDGSTEADDLEFSLSSPTHLKEGTVKKSKGFRLKGSLSSLKDSPKAQIHPEPFDKYSIRPVAIEPTSDGVSAVVTTLIHLPGGKLVPNRMSLASTLVSLRNSHHILNTNSQYNSSNNIGKVGAGVWRTAIRRRPHFAF